MTNLPKKFDFMFYADYYIDLKNAFGYNKERLENHYLNFGQYENRKYCNIDENFNWKKYLTSNKHIFDSIDKCTKENAIEHYLDNNYIDKNINTSTTNKSLFLLYFIYLNPDKNWRIILSEQFNDVIRTGIIEQSELHVVISGTLDAINEAKQILNTIFGKHISVTEVYENVYEFKAIIKIRELALIHPDKIFIYFHSKGMVNHNSTSYRTMVEINLTKNTFLNWETTLNIFEMFPNIQKAALFPSTDGFGWFNFWWARGSYLASCKPIEIPVNMVEQDRFICECWLGTYGSKTWEDCYSIVDKNISFSANPSQDVLTKIR